MCSYELYNLFSLCSPRVYSHAVSYLSFSVFGLLNTYCAKNVEMKNIAHLLLSGMRFIVTLQPNKVYFDVEKLGENK